MTVIPALGETEIGGALGNPGLTSPQICELQVQ